MLMLYTFYYLQLIFDIISICETWFNQYNLQLYNIEGYISLHN